MRVPVFSDIVAARAVVDRHLAKTPLVKSRSLSRLIGCDYYIKCENLQPVGAFKVRGGINLVATLGQYERRNGLISASTGNHGQSIAYAGQLFGTRVIIYAPAEAINPLKLQAIRDLGGEVRLHGRNFDEAREEVERVALTEGLRYVHSANEPALIAGVGTIGLEVFEDLPDTDVIIVPVGAGSGACGVGLVAKYLRPEARVIGVQSRSAPAVWRAWRQGHLTPFPTVTTRHEGLATRVPFELPSFILREVLNKFVLVTDEQIDGAIYLLAEKAKLIAEGAGAASLAAALLLREELAGRKVVGILSGGNLPLEYLCNLRLKQSETEAGG
jgi:threonine dehydratase